MDKYTALDYLERLQDDLIEQFRGLPNIAVLNKAVARQLQEVYDFLLQLKTVLLIDASSGKQLDNIGDIVQISRREAAALARQSSYSYSDEDTMYRVFLYYKIFLNTAECTYSDIMRSIYMLWDGELTYQEDPAEPATIILGYEMFNGNDNRRLLSIPILKPAGVKIRFSARGNLGMTIYAGGSTTQMTKLTFIQDSAAALPLYLIDEDGNILTDELGYILYEEQG